MPTPDTPLTESAAAPDPFQQFAAWFADAEAADEPLPHAMALATVGVDQRPSSRMVLLKGADERGFAFYTNYRSRKAEELGANPHAALLFHWPRLHRQVRITGTVTKVSATESDGYFATRPRGAQLSAWASPQSDLVPDRDALEGWFAARAEEFAGAPNVPRPPHWGGYRVSPDTVEFWQARDDRLHDRLRYTRVDDGWRLERLAP